MSFYSPLRYPGGKGRLAKYLAELIKMQTKSTDLIFVEPYAGGAGVSLDLLFSGKVSKIIINDFDKAIYSFWKVAVNDTDALIQKIKKTQVTLTEWERQKAIYKNKRSSTFDLAFATFFLNRTNRSGIIEGGPIGGLLQEGEWKINARFNKKDLVNRLLKIKEYRKCITVTKKDGIKLLKGLKQRKDFDRIFVFLDPPYVKKGKLLYLNHYKESDHFDLSEFLSSFSSNWVMTYDNSKYIKGLYSQYPIKTFKIGHHAHTFKEGKEILISPTGMRVPRFANKVY